MLNEVLRVGERRVSRIGAVGVSKLVDVHGAAIRWPEREPRLASVPPLPRQLVPIGRRCPRRIVVNRVLVIWRGPRIGRDVRIVAPAAPPLATSLSHDVTPGLFSIHQNTSRHFPSLSYAFTIIF